MRTPPLLADFTHIRVCKPFCENSLTLPIKMKMDQIRTRNSHFQWVSFLSTLPIVVADFVSFATTFFIKVVGLIFAGASAVQHSIF